MFQTFDTVAEPALGPPRVKLLRAAMSDAGVDAVLVPRADAHQGEYVPPADERLHWLTGFSGSAGFAVVTKKAAALFTDGRYTLQAGLQVDTGTFEVVDSVSTETTAWLAQKLQSGGVIGFDPWLHTADSIAALTKAGKVKGLTLKPLAKNLVDIVWGKERPKSPVGRIVQQPLILAGVAAETKIADLQRTLKAEGQDACVLTLPDTICWLLNIRGSDVAHNPVVLAFMVVPVKGAPELFVDPAKIGPDVKRYLSDHVKVQPDMRGGLLRRVADLKSAKKVVRVDAATAPEIIVRKLGTTAAVAADPCILPKARKNAAELKGARAAHVRDGAALVRYLAWLDREAPTGQLDEITVVKKLETLRAETQQLREISFATISGSGPNGAIVHYRVSTQSNRKLSPGELFLIDSGAQYQDGTTDVTRTIVIGKPTREMCQRFTLVLKAHIGLATARFPKGTRGIQLDTLARQPFWQAGMDYDHGTGHGVGSYLSVHEGPQSISKRGMANIEPGMIISNEPGFYKTGAFGIRLENLEVVTEPGPIVGGDREMMGFETLTLVPFDRRLVAVDLLSKVERDWLDAYHARVLKVIGPEVSPADRAWLTAATAPV
jgi:Xaa-Pro aminopeptidase